MTTVVMRDHDTAVAAALATIGRPLGVGEAPAGALEAVLAGTGPGYMVLHPRPGGWRDGAVDDPYADVELSYQVTCIDAGIDGVRWLSDRCDAAMRTVTVPGRSTLWVTPGVPSGVWRDDDTAAAGLFYTTPNWRLATTV